MPDTKTAGSGLESFLSHADEHYVGAKARRGRDREELLSSLKMRTVTLELTNGYRSTWAIAYVSKWPTACYVLYAHAQRQHDNRYRLRCNECNRVI